MEQLRQYFNKLLPLPDEEFNAFSNDLMRKEFDKGETLLKAGVVCDFVAFIEDGAFRFYRYTEGTEMVTAFFFAGDFISNYRSFLLQRPSNHNIECLENAVVWMIKRERIYSLYNKYPLMERMGRLIAEQNYLGATSRLDHFLDFTPEERYKALLKRNSRLLQRIPQYMIASYLGISPESLSRIRKRIVS
jgi:CRP-like cAMP-binding protein